MFGVIETHRIDIKSGVNFDVLVNDIKTFQMHSEVKLPESKFKHVYRADLKKTTDLFKKSVNS